MYKILNAEKLSANVFLMDVEAPRVAKHCLPGQFVIVKMDEVGERIPLTICDYDAEKGTVTIVFQPAGASTTRMAQLKAGDYFEDFVGPLGQPSELCHEDLEELKKKKIVFVAGGVGSAPVYPLRCWAILVVQHFFHKKSPHILSRLSYRIFGEKFFYSLSGSILLIFFVCCPLRRLAASAVVLLFHKKTPRTLCSFYRMRGEAF